MLNKLFTEFNATKAGVLIFIILLVFSLTYSEKAKSDEAYFSLGHSTLGSEFTIPSIGYRFDNNWDITLGYFGDGTTRKGKHSRSEWASVSYIVDPQWSGLMSGYFMRIGVAYTPDMNLVGDTNFRLGIGWDFGVLEAELNHFSSAGTSRINTGVDGFGITTKIKW